MQGLPEGTGPPPRRFRSRPLWLWVLALAFTGYLSIRLVEGIVWLIGLL